MKQNRESMKQGVKEERRDSEKGMEAEGKIQRKETGKWHFEVLSDVACKRLLKRQYGSLDKYCPLFRSIVVA